MVKWLHDIYIKTHNWSTFVAPQGGSWVVKVICWTKEVLIKTCGISWMNCHKYSTAAIYLKMMDSGVKEEWCQAIWSHHNVPKHNFVGWLAMKNRLQTRARLSLIGVCESNTCMLCDNGSVEDTQHLIFECYYSQQCLRRIKRWLGIHAC